MKEKKVYLIKLEIPMTGEAYSVNDVPIEATAKEIIKAFFQSNNLIYFEQYPWILRYKGKDLHSSDILFDLTSGESEIVLQMIAKIGGAS